MSFDTLQNSRSIHRILTFVGLWFDDEIKHVPALVISLLIHVPLTFTYTLLMWMEVIVSTDLYQATDVLYIALTETALIMKILSILRHRHLAKSMFRQLRYDDKFQLKNVQEHMMWRRSFKKFNLVSRLYIGCCLFVLCASLAVPLFVEEYTLPFPFWTPFDWRQPIYYWYAYIYGALAMPLTCLSNCTLDMWQCYIMQHLAACFRLNAMRLQKVGNANETDVQVTEAVIYIIRLEQEVKRMALICERIVSGPIFVQIFISALVLCFTLYRLQNFNLLADWGYCLCLIMYANCMTLQIFMPCYYAHQLTVESSLLLESAYRSNWINMSPYNRRLILLYMNYLKRPIVLGAGKVFRIGLPTFSKTINNAYSFFALLLNMDVK
ncbi:odorant receptor 94a-like [Stomoxys calcitrans]|uniref:Odorant receptor n=1 Tax=Stomoxys calcitrans TaxID=35570 RepID=A0A1I8Q1S8_STOCA|nr:odorant receptor 94a-like [Stomoxys calcitrans]